LSRLWEGVSQPDKDGNLTLIGDLHPDRLVNAVGRHSKVFRSAGGDGMTLENLLRLRGGLARLQALGLKAPKGVPTLEEVATCVATAEEEVRGVELKWQAWKDAEKALAPFEEDLKAARAIANDRQRESFAYYDRQRGLSGDYDPEQDKILRAAWEAARADVDAAKKAERNKACEIGKLKQAWQEAERAIESQRRKKPQPSRSGRLGSGRFTGQAT
jgi:hypothetical protein